MISFDSVFLGKFNLREKNNQFTKDIPIKEKYI